MKPATRSSTAAVRGHSVSTSVRVDKFEKPRAKTKVEKDSVGSMELADEFADAGFSPTILTVPTEHSYIGSPIIAQKPLVVSGTPIHELRARANAVRAALTSSLPQPPTVSGDLE